VSEAGWRAFLAADPDDWVVLHGGATAVFRTGSMREAVELAQAVAAIPGVEDGGALLTISGPRLTVRLTRDVWQLEERHVDVAQAVSDVARAHAAVPEPDKVQEVQLAIAARPDDVDVAFWRAVLGYVPVSEDNGVDPLGHGSAVWMQELDPARPHRHAMHVDVSLAREEAEQRLASALAAGGRIVHRQAEYWTLSDRAGNRVCIAIWPDGGTTVVPESDAGTP
jgi:4a-hydroxytetrahydrobiopterin dehydratase